MSTLASSPAEFAAYSPAALLDVLPRIYSSAGRGGLCIGVLADGKSTVVTFDLGKRAQGAAPETMRGPMGCVVKVLTGTLAIVAHQEGRISFDRPLADEDPVFDDSHVGRPTVRQLLSHSHGLDASDIEPVPRVATGQIDRDGITRRLREYSPLFEPGAFYSYSNAGAWLTAALLERKYGTTFQRLLTERVLRPAGVGDPRLASDAFWCPATGGDLSLSVPDLLATLKWMFDQGCFGRGALFQIPVGPPGWCLERGSCSGWKAYGSGWFGHQMALGDHSLALRAQFEKRTAIVVAAHDASPDAAGMALIRLFGRFLPEFVNMRIPRVLPKPKAAAHPASYIGTYGNARWFFRILEAHQAELALEIFPDGDSLRAGNPEQRCVLKPGTDGAYMADALALQFLSLEARGYNYLWDGRNILRRV